MRKLIPVTLLVSSSFLLPSLAWAHPGHSVDSGFIAGALHPFTGFDHLLGLVVAGLLLGWLPQRLRWLVCAAFLGSSGAVHSLWLTAGGEAGFLAGLLTISASLIAAGMAATKLASFTAAAKPRRTSPADAP